MPMKCFRALFWLKLLRLRLLVLLIRTVLNERWWNHTDNGTHKTLCRKNAEIVTVTTYGIYCYHWAVEP